ncbi:MAG: Gfo/Idh/MocA family oxidoreductase [Betaproteobacteria bacterium]|nr:Gfo/Idh/MocA family oxidoreductase [Betaproteobacteria bacterium]
MRTIRWGIIGCGDVTETKSGPGLYRATNSALVAVMRRNGALAADYARRHRVARFHDDAEAILRADDVDAVYVATTPETHRDYVLRCAAAGKPVLVEKPMARSGTECDDMIAACRRAGVPLWVAYYRRALPRFLAVRDLIESGAVGPVRMVLCRQFQPLRTTTEANPGSAPWRIDASRSGGGLFVDLMSHTLDFLDFVFGPIVEVRGFAANQGGAYRAEDVVTASWRFATGVQGSGAFCYAADRDEEWNEIIGAAGRIRFSTTRAVPIIVDRGSAVEEIPLGDPPHVHQPLIQTIVDELNGRGSCASTGESAARTTRVIDRILGDYRQQAARSIVDETRAVGEANHEIR